MIIEILEDNSLCLKNFNVIKDLINLKELLEIISDYGIKANLLEILSTDIAIKNGKQSFFKSCHFEMLSTCLTKMIRERKTEVFSKLLDQNTRIFDIFSVI